MTEIRYRQIDLKLSTQFIYVFEPKNVLKIIPTLELQIEDVQVWCIERFGDGAVSQRGAPWYEQFIYDEGTLAVAFAWIMDIERNIAFQHEDHAFEFKMRWC
jgi:hypothetical protein